MAFVPPLPKNIAKNFATFFHERGRELVDLETEHMKEQMQAKSEAFARSVVGDTDAGNLAGSEADSQGPGEKERGDPKADEV